MANMTTTTTHTHKHATEKAMEMYKMFTFG